MPIVTPSRTAAVALALAVTGCIGAPSEELTRSVVAAAATAAPLPEESVALCLKDARIGRNNVEVVKNRFSEEATLALARRWEPDETARAYAFRLSVYEVTARQLTPGLWGQEVNRTAACLVDRETGTFLAGLRTDEGRVNLYEMMDAMDAACATMSGRDRLGTSLFGC